MTTGHNMISGKFVSTWVLVDGAFCRKCSAPIETRQWDSDCGGFEDHQYRCTREGCGHSWWVDGPDA